MIVSNVCHKSQCYNNVSEQYKSLMGFSHYSNRDVVRKRKIVRAKTTQQTQIVRGVYKYY